MKYAVNQSESEGNNVIILFLFGIIVFSILFVSFMIFQQIKEFRVQTWQHTLCRIIYVGDAKVVNGNSYRLEFKYTYRFSGNEYTGSQLSKTSSECTRAQIERLREDCKTGRDINCYVNPKKPSEAVLERNPIEWSDISFCIVIILFFVVIPGWIIYYLHSCGNGSVVSLMDSRVVLGKLLNRWLLKVLSELFLISDFAGTYWGYLRPVHNTYAWTPTPCQIISSRVASHFRSKGTLYPKVPRNYNMLSRFSSNLPQTLERCGVFSVSNSEKHAIQYNKFCTDTSQ